MRARTIVFVTIAAIAAACSSKSGDANPDARTGGTVDSGGGSDSTDAGTCTADLQHDPDNCGRCGRSCGGSTCSDGLCDPQLVLDAPEEPYGPTRNELETFLANGKVYEWEYTTTNAVHYIVDSAPTTPAATVTTGDSIQDIGNDPSIDAAAFDATYVYEAIEGTGAGVNGTVGRKKLDGTEATGAATPWFSLPPDLKWKNIAVTADAVYLTGTTTLNGPQHPEPDTTAIYRIARADITDASARPSVLAGLDGRDAVVSDLSVFGSHLFWLEYDLASSDYLVYTAPTAGGAALRLDDAYTSEGSFASDGTYVYWTEVNDAGALVRVPLATPDLAHLAPVATLSSPREGIVASGGYIYAMELPDPRPLWRIDPSNGAMDLLANVEIPPSTKGTRVIGVAGGFVYLASQDAKVWRVPSAP